MRPSLEEYLASRPRGEMARIAREADVDYTTVWKLARVADYRMTDYRKAKAIADACGGEVSVEDICAPAEAARAIPDPSPTAA